MRIRDWSSGRVLFRSADHAGALGQDGRVLGLACLEQVGNARQTAGDIAGLGGFLRDTRNHIAHTHRRPLTQVDDRADRKSVVWAKSVYVRVELGGRRSIKSKHNL